MVTSTSDSSQKSQKGKDNNVHKKSNSSKTAMSPSTKNTPNTNATTALTATQELLKFAKSAYKKPIPSYHIVPPVKSESQSESQTQSQTETETETETKSRSKTKKSKKKSKSNDKSDKSSEKIDNLEDDQTKTPTPVFIPNPPSFLAMEAQRLHSIINKNQLSPKDSEDYLNPYDDSFHDEQDNEEIETEEQEMKHTRSQGDSYLDGDHQNHHHEEENVSSDFEFDEEEEEDVIDNEENGLEYNYHSPKQINMLSIPSELQKYFLRLQYIDSLSEMKTQPEREEDMENFEDLIQIFYDLDKDVAESIKRTHELARDRQLGTQINLPSVDIFKVHKKLFSLLSLKMDDTSTKRPQRKRLIYDMFKTLAALCDPFTQPIDTGKRNEQILSLDLVSNLILALNLEKYNQIFKDNTGGYFFMAYDLASIVSQILKLLNCSDEFALMNIDIESPNWKEEINKWNAFGPWLHSSMFEDFHNLKLMYTIACVSILTIYKLYGKDNNLSLNPFLSFFLQIYKCQTLVILLGLEVDRRDEVSGFPGYPVRVRHTIKGASAMRSVLAIILNDDFKKRMHDLKHESLINFMHPFGRKAGSGALVVDMRIYAASMLACGMKMDHLTSLMYGLEPDDKFDEDVKYMFELEYQDGGDEVLEDEYYMHHRSSNPIVPKVHYRNSSSQSHKHKSSLYSDDEEDEYDEDYDEDEEYEEGEEREDYEGDEEEEEEPLLELHPDCHCVFEDDDEDDEDLAEEEELEEEMDEEKEGENFVASEKELEDDNKDNGTKGIAPIGNYYNTLDSLSGANALSAAERSLELVKNDKDNDKDGNDWRDIPRGFNVDYSPQFLEFLQEGIFKFGEVISGVISDLQLFINLATDHTLGGLIYQQTIIQIAFLVHHEQECFSTKICVSGPDGITKPSTTSLDDFDGVDRIYKHISKPNFFEKILKRNPDFGLAILDELFMAPGYRRVLIWFITHLKLNQVLINYVFELLVGLRGNLPPEEMEKFPAGKRFAFSRVGPLILSKVEKMMLLHEFFANSIITLSRGSLYEDNDESNDNDHDNNDSTRSQSDSPDPNESSESIKSPPNTSLKLARLICIMINGLVKKEVLVVNDPEYKFEIQALLIQWVGVIPDAHKLFFQTNEPLDEELKAKRLLKEKNLKFKESILEMQLKGLDPKQNIENMHDIKQGNLKSTDMKFFGLREYNVRVAAKDPTVKQAILGSKLLNVLFDARVIRQHYRYTDFSIDELTPAGWIKRNQVQYMERATIVWREAKLFHHELGALPLLFNRDWFGFEPERKYAILSTCVPVFIRQMAFTNFNPNEELIENLIFFLVYFLIIFPVSERAFSEGLGDLIDSVRPLQLSDAFLTAILKAHDNTLPANSSRKVLFKILQMFYPFKAMLVFSDSSSTETDTLPLVDKPLNHNPENNLFRLLEGRTSIHMKPIFEAIDKLNDKLRSLPQSKWSLFVKNVDLREYYIDEDPEVEEEGEKTGGGNGGKKKKKKRKSKKKSSAATTEAEVEGEVEDDVEED